jgi:hypothetical protein
MDELENQTFRQITQIEDEKSFHRQVREVRQVLWVLGSGPNGTFLSEVSGIL